jgi:indole-3-glycerol phosphate synthase
VLAEIVASVRRSLDAAKDRLPREYLARLAHERAPRGELFASALARPGLVNVIAECKRRSPSRGPLCQDYRPGRIARGYQAAGAAAVSVLTEARFFGAPSIISAKFAARSTFRFFRTSSWTSFNCSSQRQRARMPCC